jgi:2-dehydropantoate 2-reductase
LLVTGIPKAVVSRARGPPATTAVQNGRVRILILGAGVIGSVYGAKLISAGHDVVLVARGGRLAELRNMGELVLQDAQTGQRTSVPASVVAAPESGDRFDLVLVPVRRDQLVDTLPLLDGLSGGPDVLFFGNALGAVDELTEALDGRAMFGFPAAGGVRDDGVIRYVLIRQQKTMLGEVSGATTPRLRQLQAMFRAAGFPTSHSADVQGWLTAHAAFVVPIAYALYRVDTNATRLAHNPIIVRQMVRATRQAFHALRAADNTQIPRNLQALYLWLPETFAVRYWRRVLAGPRGELWFAAHSRAAREEMASLAGELVTAIRRTGHISPDLQTLLAAP